MGEDTRTGRDSHSTPTVGGGAGSPVAATQQRPRYMDWTFIGAGECLRGGERWIPVLGKTLRGKFRRRCRA